MSFDLQQWARIGAMNWQAKDWNSAKEKSLVSPNLWLFLLLGSGFKARNWVRRNSPYWEGPA